MISMADMIEHLGTRHHDSQKPALVTGTDVLTYAQVRDRMWQCAHVLDANGIGAGSRVAALMNNRPEYSILFAALSALNASITPINVRFVASEVAAAVEYMRPAVFVVDRDFEALAREAMSAVDPGLRPELLVLAGEAMSPGEDLAAQLDAAPSTPMEVVADPDACAYLALTGGTTGARKAAIIPAGNFYTTAMRLALHLYVRKSDVTMTCGSFSHTMPFYYAAMQLYCGGTVVILPKFSGAAAIEAVSEHKVTWFAAVPTMYSDIMDAAAKSPGCDLSSVERYASSGAPMLTVTKDRLMGILGSEFYEYYGATEVGWATTLEPRDQLRKTRCVGQPMPGTEVKIVGVDKQLCPPGEVGVIFMRGDVIMTGYFERPDDTVQVFDGGWATVGDMGYLDEEGYLFLVDRQKDMIVSGGINVYPVEIEEVLMQLPGSVEIAVIGIPDARWGESVLAVCVVDGDYTAWEAAAKKSVTEHLSSYKRPKAYSFVDTLPRSHAGKILKRVIREPYWKTEERDI